MAESHTVKKKTLDRTSDKGLYFYIYIDIDIDMDTQRANESTIIAKVKGKTLVCYKLVLTHNNLIFVVLTTIL